ncbi:hypothetical protein LRP30_36990 [Bradyrhizobium sp. C-145]|uniref:hypothetical protein n=1 Tax=Bradyrhizobium sp. C-145 TaxID=574727 RepID=UPI00201B57D5|nr:hypothetical protein [Bradyrhizobium sp. C-145]UQR62310.1 hypothetical protein LRP30_36990 [Bradyrhizobium sp. C-145]
MHKILPVISLLVLSSTAVAAGPTKVTKSVTCRGDFSGVHTLVIGNCSFTGEPAGKVYDFCKEDDVCEVQAYGWDNGHGMTIVERVDSVKKVSDTQSSPLTPQELKMARACKAGKPCSLTCNRAHAAGRDDLIRAGACAE